MPEVVITCDWTMMSDHHGKEFLGFGTTTPAYLFPEAVYAKMFFPKMPCDENGFPKMAPYGMRKIEASLMDTGFDARIVHPSHLDKYVPGEAKVLLISGHDAASAPAAAAREPAAAAPEPVPASADGWSAPNYAAPGPAAPTPGYAPPPSYGQPATPTPPPQSQPYVTPAPSSPYAQPATQAPSAPAYPAAAAAAPPAAAETATGADQPATDEEYPPPTPLPGAGEAPYVTPLVRKLAAEHAVNLETVTGTGVGGRIRKQDVIETARTQRGSQAQAPLRRRRMGRRLSCPSRLSAFRAPSRPRPRRPDARPWCRPRCAVRPSGCPGPAR